MGIRVKIRKKGDDEAVEDRIVSKFLSGVKGKVILKTPFGSKEIKAVAPDN